MKHRDNVMTAVRNHLKFVEEELCRVELVREVKEPAMLKRWWHIIVWRGQRFMWLRLFVPGRVRRWLCFKVPL